MVSLRCKLIAKEILTRFGLHVTTVELGEANFAEQLHPGERDRLNFELLKVGLELLDNRKIELAGKIRNIIEEVVRRPEESGSINLSVYLVRQLHHDYTYLANLFLEVQGLTIEKFFISARVQVLKGYLIETDFTLREIAFRMNYSSEAHLSSQFKKVTGLTPSRFRKSKVTSV